ncbi:DUF2877 domain-containing protein [Nocardioides sp. CFH 31398]|uniref:DUF2877 domain-containing protein n=1 Tax=Nocardioides sp. CFH 31398 TaxID=2919579 RepID=UPI001F05A96C|nr:DUF2877 domain-containing protein [Nocardioides sp. CFH 31398]MCH1865930.1 DUF2877 domain-containing protein [Nocardioides sp. CFH 31398]
MLPVAAPPRVRDLLRAAPDGPVPVLHRGPVATYVEVSGRCVGLLARDAVAVPCGLRSDLPRLDHLSPLAAMRGGVLHVGGTPLRIGRLVDVRVPVVPSRATAPAPLPTSLRVGRGGGLTPYDDDVLAGWLVTHRAAGVATDDVDHLVRALFRRTTLLSATLLDCAMHGEALPELADWLAAAGTPAEDDATRALLAVGHSSGRGMLHGATTALSHLSPARRIGTAA